MGAFLFAATGLVALTLLMLLRPWQRHNIERDASARELNARIYRDQLAELDRDLTVGTLARTDHAQARDELRRRLLDDTALAESTPAQASRTRHTTLLVAIALPLAATGLYALLGAPAALLPQQPLASGSAHQVTAAEIDQMVAGLAARLEKNPADTKGWAMLARSYYALGRSAEAQAAFARIGDDLYKDPVLLADYADVLATQANGNLEGQPLQLVKTALQLDPGNPMALSLAATAAYKRKDFPEAARHWQRLLEQLPSDSEDARWLVKTLAEIGAPAAPAAAATGGQSVSGSVSLAPALQGDVRPTDTVFVYARATDGSRIPLAVQRARVADLPLQFKLDDSMAMSPQHRLSDVAEVRIEARVSRNGSATPAPGDLIAGGEVVKTGSRGVALRIDRVR
ncbi:c-type cytochrome biogenesis protein CcmI [Piscinibacter sp.]|jgi:cytochrome c-type biogenesis protein CcmH|uniref:c-type cytochrome biogenesis protein CcmI n=1 Tax=Piscinibacter sp. TaxID=1903157 RepID=UPI002F3F9E58